MKRVTTHHAFRVDYSGIVNTLITDVKVGASELMGPRRDFTDAKAVWDTGATHSVITPSIVARLNLVPIGKRRVFGVNSSDIKDVFVVDIVLPMGVRVADIQVTESDINSGDAELLIGMDIIQAGDFSISNGTGKTIFSYCIPSHRNPVDLVAKSNAVNPKIKP